MYSNGIIVLECDSTYPDMYCILVPVLLVVPTSSHLQPSSLPGQQARHAGSGAARLPVRVTKDPVLQRVCTVLPMRSRRERKVPERLEAGPATSKWSSGTVGSGDKTQSVRNREAEKGAAQPVAGKKNQAAHRKAARPTVARRARPHARRSDTAG